MNTAKKIKNKNDRDRVFNHILSQMVIRGHSDEEVKSVYSMFSKEKQKLALHAHIRALAEIGDYDSAFKKAALISDEAEKHRMMILMSFIAGQNGDFKKT